MDEHASDDPERERAEQAAAYERIGITGARALPWAVRHAYRARGGYPLRVVTHTLTPQEIRVLGCLLEKQRTTPDAYPLSLNSLRLACNQSTNRDPVVDYDESIIRDALHRLQRRGFSRLASGAGSRAPKYRHLLAEALPMDSAEQAVMCVLMLRGPQTPGELKQRSERMHAFGDLAAVHHTLEQLIARELVSRLERRPGHKEERYIQLLQDSEQPQPAGLTAPAGIASPLTAAVEPGIASPPLTAAVPPARTYEQAAPHEQAAPQQQVAPSGTELQELRERVSRLEAEVAQLRHAAAEPAVGGEG